MSVSVNELAQARVKTRLTRGGHRDVSLGSRFSWGLAEIELVEA